MDSGTTGSPFSVPSVCEGSRFSGLGDSQGSMTKFQDLISLMGFITTFFHYVGRTFPRFLKRLEFWQKIGWKPKIFRFRNDLWVLFISSNGDHINLTNCKNTLELFSRVILSPRGEHARNRARGPKTKNFKVLRCEPNFMGRLNMTNEGSWWTHSIKKHHKIGFIHDSSDVHAFPRVLRLSDTSSP